MKPGPGMIVEVIDSGWIYPTYKEISKYYNLKNWVYSKMPLESTKYKVIHYISAESIFGSIEKLIIEDMKFPYSQFIIGIAGIKVVEMKLSMEDKKLIKNNKKEKEKIFFDFNSI